MCILTSDTTTRMSTTSRALVRALPCSYVQLAVRLGRDTRYRRWAGDLIDQRSAALWERRDVVLEWARFLSRAAGRRAPTAEEVSRATLISMCTCVEATKRMSAVAIEHSLEER